MQNHIHELDSHLQNQIAAGEVVERPSSIIKELVENSIDAGSSTIKLFLQKDELAFEITDDGHGIRYDELPLALKRHTTSKIHCPGDLQNINTLGFRGEALASIASVADLTITTQHEDESQARSINIAAGKTTFDKESSHPRGTTIAIKDIFETVPARKKFLKTLATERRHIKTEFMELALASPHVGFILYENDRETLNLPPDQTPYDRVVGIYPDMAGNLIPLDTEGLDFSVQGFVSKPEKMYKRPTMCHLFVNQRPITNTMILKALKESYYTVIPDMMYPAAFVYITLDPLLVDVNVHPRKKEVKFTNPQDLYRIMYSTVQHSLQSSDLTKHIGVASTGHKTNYGNQGTPQGSPQSQFTSNTQSASGSPKSVYDTAPFANLPLFDKRRANDLPRAHRQSLDAKTISEAAGVRFIAQLQSSYLLYEDDEGLIVVDQHAMHERINYDKLKKTLLEKQPAIQQLFIPLQFDVPVQYSDHFTEVVEILRKVGFEIEELSGNSFQIRAIPKLFQKINFEKIWPDLLEELIKEKKASSIDRLIDETLHSIACRSSIMFHDTIYPEEAIQLWVQSEKVPIETSCPHGRPTKFRITFEDLNKHFLR